MASSLINVSHAISKSLNFKIGITNSEWTEDEDSILREGLAQYATLPKLKQYAKIQKLLQNKTLRDVATRCKSMNKMKNIVDSSLVSFPEIPVDTDDVLLYNKIGGLARKLLEENSEALKKISNNFDTNQIQDNINLFAKIRGNFVVLSDNLSDMPEGINNMPPLSEKINEELANIILPPPSTNYWIYCDASYN